jgi:hypothetical protein
MPMVGGKKYSYTPAGMKAAAKARKMSGKKNAGKGSGMKAKK